MGFGLHVEGRASGSGCDTAGGAATLYLGRDKWETLKHLRTLLVSFLLQPVSQAISNP